MTSNRKSLRQAVDAWNNEEQFDGEDHQEEDTQLDNLPLQEDTDRVEELPPGLSRPASIAGSATTVIVSTLE